MKLWKRKKHVEEAPNMGHPTEEWNGPAKEERKVKKVEVSDSRIEVTEGDMTYKGRIELTKAGYKYILHERGVARGSESRSVAYASEEEARKALEGEINKRIEAYRGSDVEVDTTAEVDNPEEA